MAVTGLTLTAMGQGSLLATWGTTLGGTPTFYILVNGELVGTTTAQEWLIAGRAGEQVVVEVFDASGYTATAVPSSGLTLCWYDLAAASSYRIDRWSGTAWVETARVAAEKWFYVWRTGELEDGSAERWRVVPLGADGSSEGEAVEFKRVVVRRPDAPAVDYAYDDETGKVTVSAS